MAVNTEHYEYRKYNEKWKRCRDVSNGQDAVHGAGEIYLPKLKDQSSDEYSAYKLRALFFNATWRTIAGMSGMLFRKQPRTVVPSAIEELLKDVSLSEQPLELLALEAAIEVFITGRVGILVDYPMVDTDRMTLADAKVMNLRPTMKLYQAESIINWKLRQIGNKATVVQVRLKEEHTVNVNEFEEDTEALYRVLDLDGSGYYRMRLFRCKDGANSSSSGAVADSLPKTEEQVGGDIYPLLGGKPMRAIPFYPIGVDGIKWQCDEPPLIDMVDVNLSHYRVTADYEHGCHFTGLPTPYVAGHTFANKPNGQPSGEKLYVGQSHAWVFPKPETKVGYLEFAGQGLTELRENLKEKKEMMAVLGARMLEQQKRDAETVEVASLHRSGEESVLGSISNSLSMGVKSALKTFVEWAGADSSEVEFTINKDFFPIRMQPAEVTALVSAWMSRAFSKQVLFDNLKRGQIIPDEAEFEEEEGKIAADPSLLPPPLLEEEPIVGNGDGDDA